MIPAVVESIFRTQETELPDGIIVRADSYISRDECALIGRAVAAANATRAVEVGMAYGVSTVCIADALARNADDGSWRLTSIDPHQVTQWRGAGIHLARRAGLLAGIDLIEETSQSALPRLVKSGARVRFAFIDGWHTFDHTLVDFFYVDQMLERGGMVVFDDVGYPAIGAAVRFVLANRAYEIFETLEIGPIGLARRVRSRLKSAMRPLSRTDRDPSPAHERLFRKTENAYSVALRKLDDDTRRFDHFERF